MASKVGDAFVDISTRDNKLIKGLSDAQSKTTKSMNAISAKMASVGKTMTIAGAAITAAFGLTVKSAMDFNKEIANIATLIPGSTKRVNELKSAIRTMAVTVGKDTADLAQGAYQVISAFGDTADTVDILGIAAKAATAGVATTTDAIDLLSAVTKGYGDTSKEAVQKVSDLAFQTVTLGQTTFPELAASIGKVTPLAASLGMGMDELFAVMATGTGVTGKASEVSTQLRGILQSLMSPTADMTKLINEKKYASGEAMLADLGLAGALEVIKDAADASNLPLQKYISSIEGQTLALALTGTQADTYIDKLASMRDSAGLTDIAFKEQTEGVNAAGFAFQQAKQQIIVLSQEIGDKLLPLLVPLIKKFTEILGKVREWTEENPKLFETIVRVSAIIGALAAVGGPILLAVSALIKMKVAILAIGTLTSGPIGLLIIAVGAFALAWKTNFLGIRDFTIKVVDKIKETFKRLRDSLDETAKSFTQFTDSMAGGGGAAGAFADDVDESIEALDKFALILAEVERVARETEKSTKDLTRANKKLSEATVEVFDKILALTDPRLYQIKLLDDEITKYTEAGVASNILKKYYYLELAVINKVTEAKNKLADATKVLADRIYELTHTVMEVAIKKLDEERKAYIKLGKSQKIVDKWYKLEIKNLDKLYPKKKEAIDANKKLADTYSDVSKELDKVTEKTTKYISPLMTISEMIATLGGYRRAFETGGGGFDYQQGTPYVPRTGLAVVHKGEAIIPASQNTYDQRKSYASNINIQPGAIIINTPRFSGRDAKEMIAKIKREAAMQGLKFATA